MFLGVLPTWVGDLVTIVAVALGLPSLILYFLGRKDANRKLVVEEGSLKVTEVNSQIETYQDLLTRTDNSRKEAEQKQKDQAEEYKADIHFLHGEVGDYRDLIASFREFFWKVIHRNNITLTSEEQREFDSIKPSKQNRKVHTLASRAEEDFGPSKE